MKRYKEWFTPLNVQSLKKFGALNVKFDNTEFSPNKKFKQVWQIWLLKPNERGYNHFGYILLEKSNVTEQDFRLKVSQQVIEFNSLFTIDAKILCKNDLSATPLNWDIKYNLYYNKRKIKEASILKKGNLTALKKRKNINGIVTSNWSFLEALQRISYESEEKLNFTVIDELDKIKNNQILRFIKEQRIFFGGEKHKVKVYQHIGEGWLPWLYYIDNTGRLLIAINGLKAYILNPDAITIHNRIVQQLKIRGISR